MSDLACSIVVPVYNSQQILPELISRLRDVLSAVADQFEVILVNDGSRDESWRVICELATQHPWIRGIDLMRNYGQHNALLAGIREAQYHIIVTMDDDLQHPPQEIPKLLEKLAEGYDVVYGTPQRKQHDLWRKVASEMTRVTLQSVLGAETARNASPFRVFRAQVRNAFASYQGPFVAIDVLLTWGTTRFATVPVRHNPRQAGMSTYTFRKLVTLALTTMTGFSVLPLQLASLIGFVFALFGLGVLTYVVVCYLVRGGSLSVYAFLGSIIAFFSGAQLFALGIIGEYLARMHFRIMGFPSNVIRNTIGFHEEVTSWTKAQSLPCLRNRSAG